jgi:hypothetical protein
MVLRRGAPEEVVDSGVADRLVAKLRTGLDKESDIISLLSNAVLDPSTYLVGPLSLTSFGNSVMASFALGMTPLGGNLPPNGP